MKKWKISNELMKKLRKQILEQNIHYRCKKENNSLNEEEYISEEFKDVMVNDYGRWVYEDRTNRPCGKLAGLGKTFIKLSDIAQTIANNTHHRELEELSLDGLMDYEKSLKSQLKESISLGTKYFNLNSREGIPPNYHKILVYMRAVLSKIKQEIIIKKMSGH